MKVNQIYKTYNIPPNLQRHMLRVAGLAEILSENWTGETINKTAMVFACLFHDACKLLNFDLSRPELFEEEAENIDYWRWVQTEIAHKRGTNEHKATLQVCKEIMLPTKAIQLIDNLEWCYINGILEYRNMESAITVYSDMRIGPFGIITLEERFNELRSRVAV